MSEKQQVDALWGYISRSIDRILACLDGVPEDDLNWRPLESANSLYVLATHILGTTEENIVGTLCGKPVQRQREAEFAARGASAEPIRSRWFELRVRIQHYLERLPPGELDRTREHPRRGPLTGREVLIVVARHAAEHMGQAELTRDLLLKPRDEYAGLAGRYDRFSGPIGEYDPAEVEFFRRLFEEHGVRRVLDCACGTGRHLPLFRSLCPDVVGSDLSPAMLAQAEKNLANLGIASLRTGGPGVASLRDAALRTRRPVTGGLAVPLLQADYRELPSYFDLPFDAVACLSTSIAHMPNETEALRAFESMRAVLRDGGLLILTQGTSDRQWQEKPRFLLASDDADLTRLFAIDYVGEGARYHVVDIVHRPPGELLVWSTDFPRMYLQEDHRRLLAQAGFRAVSFYGGYDLAAYDKGASRRLIVVAEK